MNFRNLFSKKSKEEIKQVEVVRQEPYISTPDDMTKLYDIWDIIEAIEVELKTKPKNKKEYCFIIHKILDKETETLVKKAYIDKGWSRFECFENSLIDGTSIITLKKLR